MLIRAKIYLLCIAILITKDYNLHAQYGTNPTYPQGYFMYPVKAAIGLNANFGELRPNHWHMGLDCKTDKRENLPLLAAADGYIAKIKIEPYGFGRAIYINHPNGYTTLYAHCNDFYPALEAWVKQQQYAARKWHIFIDSIPANLFPVTKGQYIANSGNTGGSQGPHLHFEIRHTATDKVLNPLLFGFNIPDNVPPKISKLVVYDRCQSVYQQNAITKNLTYTKGVYDAGIITINTEQVSFAIAASDAVNGSTNPNGIYEATVYDNDVALCGFRLNDIGYNETRYLNAHIDYKMKAAGGSYVQHVSALPGYTTGIYTKFSSDGVVHLTDGLPHRIKIIVKDVALNASVVQYTIINKNAAVTRSKDSMRNATTIPFYSNNVNVLDKEDIFFYLPQAALYDSIHFTYAKATSNSPKLYSAIHQVHTATVPLHVYFTINLKANKDVSNAIINKLLIKNTYGSKYDVAKANFANGWYSASFRNFGTYSLVYDAVPPVVVPIGIKEGSNLSKAKGFSIQVTDDYESIRNFEATVDGQWILCSNDKGKVFKHTFDQVTTPGSHVLRITVQDEAGNTTEKNINFTR